MIEKYAFKCLLISRYLTRQLCATSRNITAVWVRSQPIADSFEVRGKLKPVYITCSEGYGSLESANFNLYCLKQQ